MHDIIAIRSQGKPLSDDQHYGFAREAQFLRAWQPRWHKRRHHAQWLRDVKPTNGFGDNMGFDMLLLTRFTGRHEQIPVQLKSSFTRAKGFDDTSWFVPVVVVHPDVSDLEIRQRTIFAIIKKYPELRNMIPEAGCQLSSVVIESLADENRLVLRF